jgi:hypothetical protein
MSNKSFTVYHGKFPCHTCGEEVKTMRFWPDTAKCSFMCSKKHLSEVLLVKTKHDFIKENNE